MPTSETAYEKYNSGSYLNLDFNGVLVCMLWNRIAQKLIKEHENTPTTPKVRNTR